MSQTTDQPAPTTPWLYRPASIRLLWIVFAVILAATVLAQVFVHLHPHFELEGWFGFNALFGFFSCVAMVVFAKLLGVILKRPDDYYEPSEPAAGDGDD